MTLKVRYVMYLPAHENDWQPVHWWIHAGDGNIVSPHPSVTKQKQTTKQRKGGTKTQTRPYTQVREATQHHAETRDPPARIPEITWRKPNGITSHPNSLRSKQRQRRVATRVVRRKVKQKVKHVLMREKQM